MIVNKVDKTKFKFWLLIRAMLREQVRWAVEHLYSLLILTPLVLGLTYSTVTQMLDQVSEAPEWKLSAAGGIWLGVLSIAGLVALSMSRASAELYHLRQPESTLEALPLPTATHFHLALATRLARTSLVGVVVVIIYASTSLASGLSVALNLLPSLAVVVGLIALTELSLALTWVHWHRTRNGSLLIGALVVLLLTTVLAGSLLASVVQQIASPLLNQASLVGVNLGAGALLYVLAISAHRRWRASDIEYAARLNTKNRWHVFSHIIARLRLKRSVAAQLARDLQLTLRGFSSAVYVAVGLSALVLLALFALLATDLLPPATETADLFNRTWQPAVIATKVACVLATVSLATLVSVIVAHELPHLWLERVVGTTGREMYDAKLWYARLISSPAAPLAWLVGAASAHEVGYAIPLLLECVWMWWLTSSLIGVLAFETPTRPGLSVILMVTTAGAMGLLTALFWPFGLVLYAFGMAQLTHRGHARAKYLLLTGGD